MALIVNFNMRYFLLFCLVFCCSLAYNKLCFAEFLGKPPTYIQSNKTFTKKDCGKLQPVYVRDDLPKNLVGMLFVDSGDYSLKYYNFGEPYSFNPGVGNVFIRTWENYKDGHDYRYVYIYNNLDILLYQSKRGGVKKGDIIGCVSDIKKIKYKKIKCYLPCSLPYEYRSVYEDEKDD